MAWQTPIYDRSQSNIAAIKNLITLINENGYDSLTDAQKAIWEEGKGSFNVSDHIRIEGNIEYIKTLFEGIGYTVPAISFTSATGSSLAWASYFNILATDIETLRKVLLPSTSDINYPDVIPLNGYTTLKTNFVGGKGNDTVNYETINTYEKNLAIIKPVIEAVPGYTLYCGTFYCGNDFHTQLLTGVV